MARKPSETSPSEARAPARPKIWEEVFGWLTGRKPEAEPARPDQPHAPADVAPAHPDEIARRSGGSGDAGAAPPEDGSRAAGDPGPGTSGDDSSGAGRVGGAGAAIPTPPATVPATVVVGPPPTALQEHTVPPAVTSGHGGGGDPIRPPALQPPHPTTTPQPPAHGPAVHPPLQTPPLPQPTVTLKPPVDEPPVHGPAVHPPIQAPPLPQPTVTLKPPVDEPRVHGPAVHPPIQAPPLPQPTVTLKPPVDEPPLHGPAVHPPLQTPPLPQPTVTLKPPVDEPPLHGPAVHPPIQAPPLPQPTVTLKPPVDEPPLHGPAVHPPIQTPPLPQPTVTLKPPVDEPPLHGPTVHPPLQTPPLPQPPLSTQPPVSVPPDHGPVVTPPLQTPPLPQPPLSMQPPVSVPPDHGPMVSPPLQTPPLPQPSLSTQPPVSVPPDHGPVVSPPLQTPPLPQPSLSTQPPVSVPPDHGPVVTPPIQAPPLPQPSIVVHGHPPEAVQPTVHVPPTLQTPPDAQPIVSPPVTHTFVNAPVDVPPTLQTPADAQPIVSPPVTHTFVNAPVDVPPALQTPPEPQPIVVPPVTHTFVNPPVDVPPTTQPPPDVQSPVVQSPHVQPIVSPPVTQVFVNPPLQQKPPVAEVELETVTPPRDTPAVIESDRPRIVEDVNVSRFGMLTATGEIFVTDPDPGQGHMVPTVVETPYGTFTVFVDDTWSYVASNANPLIQALPDGRVVTDTATVYSVDGTPHVLRVEIVGTDDSPTITATSGVVTEDRNVDAAGQLNARGVVTVADPDAGQSGLQAQTGWGRYGLFAVGSDGTWRYAADNDQPEIQRLHAGQTLTDSFLVRTVDGTPVRLTVTIQGADDRAIIASTVGHVTEDHDVSVAGRLTARGTITVSDPDAGDAAIATRYAAATYGRFEIHADGSWTYSVDNTLKPVQALHAGQTLVDRATVLSADGTPHPIEVVIHGSDDAPVVVAPPGWVIEDRNVDAAGQLNFRGSVSVADADAGQSGVPAQAGWGRYGYFTVASDGTWHYAADNDQRDIQGLDSGQTLTDSFAMRTADGTVVQLQVTIAGKADAPVIDSTVGHVTEDHDVSATGRLTASGTISVSDATRLFGGVRGLYERSQNDLLVTFQLPGGTVVQTDCSPGAPLQRVTDWSATGRIGLQHDLSDDVMAYGQLSRGYKSGGFSNSTCGNQYNPEAVNAIETGLKTRFLDRRATLNLS
ncbi:MAG: TonB-dependent receptor, partial [Proteobacteria bacterium]|nr:TonB-dependent receptor [Pseudomonadota bacterium]